MNAPSTLQQRSQCVRAIAASASLAELRAIHARIHRPDLFVLNKLIQAYASHGSPLDAAAVFARIDPRDRDCFSWALMISCYARNALFAEAKTIFDGMPEWNMVALNSMLAAHAQTGHFLQTNEFFARMPGKDLISWTTILNLYAQKERSTQVKQIFNTMPLVNLVSWTVMLHAYAQSGHFGKAQELYSQMPQHDVVSSSLILGASPNPDAAREIFDAMPIHNTVSWTAMLARYAHSGQIARAEEIFHSVMRERDLVAWNAMLCAYASAGNTPKSIETFAAMPFSSLVSWNAMIAAHAQSGQIEEAKCLFDRLPEKDLISWSSLLAGFARAGDTDLCQRFFDTAPERDTIAWNSLLLAYARACDLPAATKIFDSIPERDLISWNELLLAFAQRGHLHQARDLFSQMPERSIASWGTMLAAYAQTGHHSDHVLALFFDLNLESLPPDETSLASLLIACGHLGDPEVGGARFRSIATDFAITPTKQHYCCVVDLLCRAGHLASARDLIKAMPFAPDLWEWSCFLAACRSQDDLGSVVAAANRVLGRDPRAYVLVANVYSQRIPREEHSQRTPREWKNPQRRTREKLISISGKSRG
ncbi:pentatricopeptide repeat-containing protein At4g02750-like [Selaginella moellendorffii]|uniref:pentatricopeptide repeat-containing protein At4g02750-like n=1 Tax=Selaginella moellendorffii TaxID=88036 RepID=UPI000D1CF6C1|nr:pentatricopeptide repeat-containing protein At4g02750-like [Selaginella moellendorffii]|eukprot:XP_024541278.1 pentatricopeptide repeat-containing protein At4g02750-like [Selaginella moellendorffii]